MGTNFSKVQLALAAVSLVLLVSLSLNFTQFQSIKDKENNISELQSNVQNLKTANNELNTSLEDKKNRISSLNSQIETLQSNVNEKEQRISEIQDRPMVTLYSFSWTTPHSDTVDLSASVANYGENQAENTEIRCGLRRASSSQFYEVFEIEGINIATSTDKLVSRTVNIGGQKAILPDDVMLCVVSKTNGLNLDKRLYEEDYPSLFSEDSENTGSGL